MAINRAEQEWPTWMRVYGEPEPDALERMNTVCCGCGKPKSTGLIVCWACFKSGPMPFKYFTGNVAEWLKAKGERTESKQNRFTLAKMKTNPTPAPWKAEREEVLVAFEGRIIEFTVIPCNARIQVRLDDGNERISRAKADAALIAAAPDLLRIVRRAHELLQRNANSPAVLNVIDDMEELLKRIDSGAKIGAYK